MELGKYHASPSEIFLPYKFNSVYKPKGESRVVIMEAEASDVHFLNHVFRRFRETLKMEPLKPENREKFKSLFTMW